jgi:hypothetical protein
MSSTKIAPRAHSSTCTTDVLLQLILMPKNVADVKLQLVSVKAKIYASRRPQLKHTFMDRSIIG